MKEEHLLEPRSREELLRLLADAGIAMEVKEFEAALRLAADTDGVLLEDDQQQCCSLDAFLKARKYMLQQQAQLL